MSQALITRPAHGVRNLTVVVLAVWFLLALGGSLRGVFDSEPRPPLPLGLAAVVPVAVFVACDLTSARFRQFVASTDVRLLTLAQLWRVGGVVFLIRHSQGALPGVFALPAGWGDIAIGVTAPLAAWLWNPLVIGAENGFSRSFGEAGGVEWSRPSPDRTTSPDRIPRATREFVRRRRLAPR